MSTADEKGDFVKVPHQGVTDELWAEMVSYGKSGNLKAGDYKKLNLPFENKLHALPRNIRDRMCKGVEEFVYELLTEVFNAGDTAPIAVDAILKAGSYDLGPKAERVEDPGRWSEEMIRERASKMKVDKGPKGDFDD